MRVIGAVMKRQPVAGALFQQELLLVRIGLAVYREAVKFARAPRNLFKHHVQAIRWRWLRWLCAEDRVVPIRLRWRHPLRSAVPVCILDDDAQPALAHWVFRRAEDPNAGLVHFYPGIDALPRTQHQDI